jgi:hypothetical protein
MNVSNESCENECCEDERYEIYEEEGCEEEEDALAQLAWLVRSLSVRIDKLKADCVCCSFEESAEDFPVRGEDVLGSPAHDGEVDDCIAIEVADSSPDATAILDSSE